jgi:hypothetical protein
LEHSPALLGEIEREEPVHAVEPVSSTSRLFLEIDPGAGDKRLG